MDDPLWLYKIVSLSDWKGSKERVQLPAMDKDFIHLATEEQLEKVARKYWSDCPSYVILKLNKVMLPGNLILESNPDGKNLYYHLYKGFIPLSAVIEYKIITK